MKSRFFKDTQGLDHSAPPCDKVCVCLCLSRQCYQLALEQASRLHLTSGEYIERLIASQSVSASCAKARPASDIRQTRLPPAPPGH